MTAIYVAAAVVAAASAYESSVQAKKAQKARNRANQAARDINKIRNTQSKRAFLKKFRAAQANTIAAGVAAGIGLDSSAIRATRSAQASQRALAIGEFDEMQDLSDEQLRYNRKAGQYGLRAGNWGAVSQFAASFAMGGFTAGTGPTTSQAAGSFTRTAGGGYAASTFGGSGPVISGASANQMFQWPSG